MNLTDPPITVGRTVHYHDADGDVRAAIVVHVWSDTCCNLAVFDAAGHTKLAQSATKGGIGQIGTWSYPVRA